MSTPAGNLVEKVLKGFNRIQLGDIGEVRLMNRRDIKYVFPVQQLTGLLEDLRAQYSVLQVSGTCTQSYETLYYDTEDLRMYHMHHRGEYERHKIRIRKYTDTEKAFLEVKVKDNRGITEKNRLERMPGKDMVILSDEEEFLNTHTPFDQKNLVPVLVNSFSRITLVNLERKVRITIDFNLNLRLLRTGRSASFPGIAIAEVKGDDPGMQSELINLFRKYRIKPMRFSKYCLGVSKLDPDVVSHRFRSRIRQIERIEKDAEEHSKT